MGVRTPTLVREASGADAAAIGEIHADAWRVAHQDLFESPFLHATVESHRRSWPGLMAAPEFAGTTVLVAERGHHLAAFAHFGPAGRGNRRGEIFACYARPAVWGTGVAAALLDDVLAALADQGCLDVTAWALAGANRARRFYEKAGFRESGRYRERDHGDGRPVLELEYVRSLRHLRR